MPRRERTWARPQAIMGSARSFTKKTAKTDTDKIRGGEDWQRIAWDLYDLIGEYRQAPNITGALLSRAKLVPLERGSDGTWAPTKNPVVLAATAELCGGEEGQSEMFRQWGLHAAVAGEYWIVGPSPRIAPVAEADDWQFVAATSITRSTLGEWKINGKPLEDAAARTKIQVWRPHPANAKRADSPTRATIHDLNNLLQLRKRVSAQIDSRLTGAGVWLLPEETEFPAAPVRMNHGDPAVATDAVVQGAQGLADLMFDRMQIAIEDPASAEAMMPLIGTVPGDTLEKIQKPFNFWSDLDKAAPALRAELIETIARGMDIPPEVLLGASGSNHWNMWLSDENNVKIHGEPTLKILISALTSKYLRPAIEGEAGISDPRQFKYGVDTSQMRLRPNRSKEAQELNKSLLLSDEATLRENGFTEEDMMTEDGLRLALLRRMASGQTTPEIVAAANRLLGVQLPEITDHRPPAEARPTPSLEDHPVRELPQRASEPDAASAGIIALSYAAEQMVDRALQRAGNRIKTKFGIKNPEAPANRLYLTVELNLGDIEDILQDAWECTELDDYGVEAQKLARALDFYTRSVLMSRRVPSRTSIQSALRLMLAGNLH